MGVTGSGKTTVGSRLAAQLGWEFAEAYRKKLGIGGDVRLVYLKGSYELIASRLRARRGHFATEAILADQFAALEEPEDAIVVDGALSPEEIVAEIRRKLSQARVSEG